MSFSLLEWLQAFPHRPITESFPPRALLHLVPPLPSRQTLAILVALAVLLAVRVWSILPRDDVRGEPWPRTRTTTTVAAVVKPTNSSLPEASGEEKNGEAKQGVKVAVFLGSGGHTTELLQLLQALPPQRYSSRLYILSSGDAFSRSKAEEVERRLSPPRPPSSSSSSSNIEGKGRENEREGGAEEKTTQIIEIPRARKVHQSLLSTPFSVAYSLGVCVWVVALRPFLLSLLLKAKTKGAKEEKAKGKEEGKEDGKLADLIILNGPGTCVPIVLAVYVLRILNLPTPKTIYIESFARVQTLSLTARILRPLVDRFVVQWPIPPPLPQGIVARGRRGIDGRGRRGVWNGWLI